MGQAAAGDLVEEGAEDPRAQEEFGEGHRIRRHPADLQGMVRTKACQPLSAKEATFGHRSPSWPLARFAGLCQRGPPSS